MHRSRIMKTDFAILIMSCDKYSDTWEPFYICFKKYFNTCPYPLVLSTESNKYADTIGFDSVIYSGSGEWCERLIYSLKILKVSHIFLLLDDFWLCSYIDQYKFECDLNYIRQNNIGALYLNYEPWKFLVEYNVNYFLWNFGNIYRANTRPAFWNVNYFLSILQKDENIWQFERIASMRESSNKYLVLCQREQYFKFIYAVTAGKYERSALKFAQHEKINIDCSRRAQRNIFETLVLQIRNKIFNICPDFITKVKIELSRKEGKNK